MYTYTQFLGESVSYVSLGVGVINLPASPRLLHSKQICPLGIFQSNLDLIGVEISCINVFFQSYLTLWASQIKGRPSPPPSFLSLNQYFFDQSEWVRVSSLSPSHPLSPLTLRSPHSERALCLGVQIHHRGQDSCFSCSASTEGSLMWGCVYFYY